MLLLLIGRFWWPPAEVSTSKAQGNQNQIIHAFTPHFNLIRMHLEPGFKAPI
jgi:hypothetical protein